jgi:hypothetical protein
MLQDVEQRTGEDVKENVPNLFQAEVPTSACRQSRKMTKNLSQYKRSQAMNRKRHFRTTQPTASVPVTKSVNPFNVFKV